MKIVILGANGQVGAAVGQEALERGHEVVGVTRSSKPDYLGHGAALHRQGDAGSPDFLAPVISGADVVVNALRPAEGREQELVENSLGVMEACRQARIRLVVSGGAGSMPVSEEPDAPQVIETEYVQDPWRAIATASTAQYNGMLEAGGNLDWTYIAAPAMLGDGPRRGTYRSSTKALVTRPDGTSELSWSDFAVVVVDEIERPSGARRLTAAY